MALSNYSELITSISDWAARTDTTITNLADDFLDIAESKIYRKLRVRDMEKRSRATLTAFNADTNPNGLYLALPDDYLEMRSMTIIRANAQDYEINFMPPAQMQELDGVGYPSFYTITSEIVFNKRAVEDLTIESHYYKKLTALSNSNTTNWLLTNAPEVLLDGALWALNKYLKDFEEASIYFNQMIDGVERLNVEDKMGRYGNNLRVRSKVA